MKTGTIDHLFPKIAKKTYIVNKHSFRGVKTSLQKCENPTVEATPTELYRDIESSKVLDIAKLPETFMLVDPAEHHLLYDVNMVTQKREARVPARTQGSVDGRVKAKLGSFKKDLLARNKLGKHKKYSLTITAIK